MKTISTFFPFTWLFIFVKNHFSILSHFTYTLEPFHLFSQAALSLRNLLQHDWKILSMIKDLEPTSKVAYHLNFKYRSALMIIFNWASHLYMKPQIHISFESNPYNVSIIHIRSKSWPQPSLAEFGSQWYGDFSYVLWPQYDGQFVAFHTTMIGS